MISHKQEVFHFWNTVYRNTALASEENKFFLKFHGHF